MADEYEAWLRQVAGSVRRRVGKELRAATEIDRDELLEMAFRFGSVETTADGKGVIYSLQGKPLVRSDLRVVEEAGRPTVSFTCERVAK